MKHTEIVDALLKVIDVCIDRTACSDSDLDDDDDSDLASRTLQ
jgi:hypothetical protein